ncbi:hypothetical protein AYI68_g1761 [Smittium mucronatum]|uniref:Uncharacterized protein n=1 Tax=Smittium mucronatum TaxID=133383 RepID=A0A1R0H4F9_9FUNG|nr:hypothetical protein AYI68_g1761 [Smittium mucronatum]
MSPNVQCSVSVVFEYFWAIPKVQTHTRHEFLVVFWATFKTNRVRKPDISVKNNSRGVKPNGWCWGFVRFAEKTVKDISISGIEIYTKYKPDDLKNAALKKLDRKYHNKWRADV